MDEIDPKFPKIQQQNQTTHAPSSGRQAPQGSRAFDSLLEEQVGKNKAEPAKSHDPPLPELTGTVRARQFGADLDKTEFTKRFETSLDLLESYAAWLSDPEKSLRQARSLLDELILQTRTLEASFAAHAHDNPAIEEMLSLFKTTVQVEQIKFDRGDYLPG